MITGKAHSIDRCQRVVVPVMASGAGQSFSPRPGPGVEANDWAKSSIRIIDL